MGNLQYLDVSHNKVDTLEGLSGLMHLRELRVERNELRDLRGIECLDGLLRLSLRGNMLTEVNFEGCEL